jgi:hypothetical protein
MYIYYNQGFFLKENPPLAELAVISLRKLKTGGKIWRWGLTPKLVGGETQATTAAQVNPLLPPKFHPSSPTLRLAGGRRNTVLR